MRLFEKFKRKQEKEQSEEVDKLIDEIFELSKEFSNERGEYPRSFHKFKNDIFYLDSARYEIEMTLNRLGKDVESFYNNKYKPTKMDNEEDGCYANSMGAFMEIFENFKKLYKSSTKYDYALLNNVCDKCCEDLKQVIEILGDKNEIAAFLNDTYATEDKKKKKYKECLDYVSKEKIIIEISKIAVLLEKSCEVLPEHLEDFNFDYAKLTINYIEEECNNLINKIESFKSYSKTVENESRLINSLKIAVDRTKEIKRPLEIDLSLIKMDYKCGQLVNDESFIENVQKIKLQIDEIKDIIRTLWEEYKQFV